MADNENQSATLEKKEPQKPVIVAKAGAPQRMNFTLNNNGDVGLMDENGKEETVINKPENTNGTGSNENKNTPFQPTEEQLKEYFKSIGVEYESTEKLKEKLTQQSVSLETTPEQKEAQAKAFEKRRIDLFISGGGKVEDYVAIKNIAEGDLAELSISALKKELKEAKFTNEEIDKLIKERYYQISDEDLEQEEDETDKAFKKRSKEYFATKLANRSSHTKKQAANILAELDKVLSQEDLQQKEELTTSSKIDEQFKTLPRKLNFDIGEINGKPIPPITYEVSESDLTEIQSTLKDADKRNNLFFNKDGSLNLPNLANVLTRNKYLESALKVAYHEGSTRANAFWEKTFGKRSPQELGVGGSSQVQTDKNGKPVTYGKTQRVSLQHN